MSDRRLRVFVSSSSGKLGEEREAASAVIRTLRLVPVFDEAGPEGCDVFVGIYWQSYGLRLEGGVSGLEEEYTRGRALPRFLYAKEPAPERETPLERLLARMTAEERVRSFATPGELAELLVDDLAALLSQRFHGDRASVQDLPEGTVSFLFVDIDGSTPLVRQLGDAYPAVLDAFRLIVTESTRRHAGAVADFDGDGVVSAFSVPAAAARAAIDVQSELAIASWPENVTVRARIGVHTGGIELTPNGYVGLEVHRAARIGAAANGGQVLISRATADLLGELDNDVELLELGSFALKGLDRSEPLLQLVAPGLERDLPPPRARAANIVHLPTHLTELIGRSRVIADVVERLQQREVRLLTLTGPGGMGKTRLAVASAALVAAAYPDGVHFVALEDAATAEQVPGVIAESLGLRTEGARALVDTIEDHLSHGRVLLVLDNFEHVRDARSVVTTLLSGCPGTDVLVTSRTPLRVQGEHELPVPPLAESAAVQLFLERAQATSAGWMPSPHNAEAVREICRRLEGLPLAIELAAARLRVLDPAALLGRLGRRLDVVGGSVPDLPDRQHTLTSTIAWSYDLLDESEQTLFARLAVFAGGWTVEAAEAVCGDQRCADVLGSLERLVENSLVLVESGSSGQQRMRMLETIREFAADRLRESGDEEETRRRHTAYFDDLVQNIGPLFSGRRTPEAMMLLDDEWENIEATVAPRVAARAFEPLVEIASATWRYVWLFDRVRDATAWMPSAYEARDELEPRLRGELCRIWGSSLYQLGRYEEARVALEEAVDVLAESGPSDREAWARTILAGLLPHFEASLVGSLAEVTRAVEIFRAEQNEFGLATSLGLQGTITTLLGDPEEGLARIDEGLAAAEVLGLSSMTGTNRTLRALARLASGDVDAAHEDLRVAAGTYMYLEGTAYCLEGLAAVALAEGDSLRAATALGAAEGLRERTGIEMWPVLRMALQPTMEALDAGGSEVAEARYEGRHLSPRGALARLARDETLAFA